FDISILDKDQDKFFLLEQFKKIEQMDKF
ncbi:GTP-binding protein, partial [Campylobacter coli]|nr:GTP-binding protein [Campylobacter coli]